MSFEHTLATMLARCPRRPRWATQRDFSRRATRWAWHLANATKAVRPRRRVWPFSERYTRYMTSTRWKTVRCIVLFLAEFRCDECGSGGAVEVHHLTYQRFGRERLDDLQPLCRECHERKHGGPLATSINAMAKHAGWQQQLATANPSKSTP